MHAESQRARNATVTRPDVRTAIATLYLPYSPSLSCRWRGARLLSCLGTREVGHVSTLFRKSLKPPVGHHPASEEDKLNYPLQVIAAPHPMASLIKATVALELEASA